MKSRSRILLAVVGLLVTLACGVTPTPVGPTLTPFVIGNTTLPPPDTPVGPAPTSAPTATGVPVTPTTPPMCADDLATTVQAALPAGAYDEIGVLPLIVPPGWQPLWAVFSVGMRHFELSPTPAHFVAVYACEASGWRELAQISLDEASPPEMYPAAPDIVFSGGIAQVQIDPSRVWLTVSGGVGAHGGTFQLLSFDGVQLSAHVSATSASPGLGSLEDLDGDGAPDVILDQSDAYVFCYACGVRKIYYQVFTWDQVNQRMLEAHIDYFYMGQPQPMRDVVNPAVDMASAGLWKDALVEITRAKDMAVDYPECNIHTLTWNYALIKLHADAMARDANMGIYPLLSRVFYGDYAAAVDLMRPYSPAQVFDPAGPLIAGTVAEGFEGALSGQIIQSADAALGVKPDLAEAYFLRGWARYLVDPTSPQARADVQQAAVLKPGDAFFADCAALFP